MSDQLQLFFTAAHERRCAYCNTTFTEGQPGVDFVERADAQTQFSMNDYCVAHTTCYMVHNGRTRPTDAKAVNQHLRPYTINTLCELCNKRIQQDTGVLVTHSGYTIATHRVCLHEGARICGIEIVSILRHALV